MNGALSALPGVKYNFAFYAAPHSMVEKVPPDLAPRVGFNLAFDCKAEMLYALLWFLKGPAAPKYHAPPSNQFGKVSAPSSVKTPGGSQAKVVPIASLNPYQSK